MCVDSVLSSDLPRIILSRQHVDDRGWFSETFHEQRLRDLGISCRFVQDNQSGSKRAVRYVVCISRCRRRLRPSWPRGFVTADELCNLATKFGTTAYGRYLQRLIHDPDGKPADQQPIEGPRR
jgi:hypothetical protein